MSEQTPSGAFLIVHSQVIPLEKAEITLGRGPDNDLVINDPGVSRHHARLVARGGNFQIDDLDSLSGTYVNGAQVRQGKVSSGDIISLAGVSMLYVENQPKLFSALWEETRPPEQA